MGRRDRIEQISESGARVWAPSSDGRVGHGKDEWSYGRNGGNCEEMETDWEV